jgi:membrane associated rhomboid family serine protease
MFRSIWSDLVKEYKFANKVIRLIFANVAIFLFLKVLTVVLFILYGQAGSAQLGEVVHFLSISADPLRFITRPWTWISHMFLHVGFFHLLINMLYLYWFGRIAGDLIGDRRIFPLYFIGGWFGVILFMLFALTTNWIPSGAFAYGASAAVLAITTAAGVVAPDYEIRLIFIGNVKLKYIVAVLILINILSIGGANTGGSIGHLGGVLWGFLYVYLLRRGIETGEFINRILDIQLFSQPYFKQKEKRSYQPVMKMQVNRSPEKASKNEDFEEKLDEILDKIKHKGIHNLTKAEREFLEKASNRNKS